MTGPSLSATDGARASVNQDFVIYAGDSPTPVFTVMDSSGVVVDISAATEITWTLQRNLTDAVVLTKKKSTGGITFVTNGTDGKFQVLILAADTATLSDWYMHSASLTGVGGAANVFTAAAGRMLVQPTPSWTWIPSLVGVEPLYTVRRIIGDVRQSDQLLTDQEIKWAIGAYSNEWLAAAECARNIAAGFSVQIDLVQGELKTNYSNRARAFRILAIDLEQRGMSRGGVTAYVGGTSVQDKVDNAGDTDRVPPQFVLAWSDNLLPESPVGHQTNAAMGLPDQQNDTAAAGII